MLKDQEQIDQINEQIATLERQEAELKAEKSAIRDYINTYEQDATRRLLKLVCVALHQTFGFGPQRLRRTLDAANATASSG